MAKNNNVSTFVLRGNIQWAKVFGEPRLNYNKDGREWTFDFIPDDPKNAKADLKAAGVADRLRSKDGRYNDAPYLTFKQREFRADGTTKNEPIRVVDAAGKPWDPSVELGNDTKVDVKFVVIDSGAGRFPGIYPRSIRVLKLEKFERQDFEELSEDDEFYEAAKEAEERIQQDALDDDLPFDEVA